MVATEARQTADASVRSASVYSPPSRRQVWYTLYWDDRMIHYCYVMTRGEFHESHLDSFESKLTSGCSYNVSFCIYKGATFDASTTNLTYSIPVPHELSDKAQPLEVVLSFLSPITPTSTLRQAIPASYFSIHVQGSFDVNIYVDVNGQWVSGDRGSQIIWDLEKHEQTHGNSLKTWKIQRKNELLLSEFSDRAEWGALHFTAPSVCTVCFPEESTSLTLPGCPP